MEINQTGKSYFQSLNFNGIQFHLEQSDYIFIDEKDGKIMFRPNDLSRLKSYKPTLQTATLPQVSKEEFIKFVLLKDVKKAFKADSNQTIQVFLFDPLKEFSV